MNFKNMGKIIKLKDSKKYLKPNSFTLVGGFFDLFHVGHLRFLKEASKYKKPLVALIFSDKLVKKIKGSKRPIIKEIHRAEIVASISFVDYVLILDDLPQNKNFKPEYIIFSKQNAHARKIKKEMVEKKFPESKVIFITQRISNISTTKIEDKIININK